MSAAREVSFTLDSKEKGVNGASQFAKPSYHSKKHQPLDIQRHFAKQFLA